MRDVRGVVRYRVSPLLFIIILLFTPFASLISRGAASAAEPAFPGRGAEEDAYLQYWEKFGNYALDNAPDSVKKGTDIDKAKYIMGRVGDKLAAHGIAPNTAYLFGPGGGRVGGALAEGPCDRGSCGDVTNALQHAFEGAGISGGSPLLADVGSVEATTNIFSVNRDHGSIALVDKNGKIHVFDLWYHGKDKGTFAGAETSQWNGMTGQEWRDRLKNDGYERFGEPSDGGIFGEGNDVIDQIGQKWSSRIRFEEGQREKKEKYTRRKGEEKRKKEEKENERKKAAEETQHKADEERRRQKQQDEARRKAEEQARLQAALRQAEALIAAARAAAGRAQSAIAAASGAATAGSAAASAASAAQGAVQQARGAVDAARSACARVVSEGVIDAARARAEAAAGEVGPLYQEAVDLAVEACKIAGLKVSQGLAQENNRKLSQGLAARAKIKVGSAQAALARARAEAAQAAVQNSNRQVAIQANESARAAIAAARGQVSAAEGVLQSYEATVGSAQGQLGAARTAIDEVEQKKAAARGVLEPFLSEPNAQPNVQMMLPVINGVVVPSLQGVDQPVQQALSAIQQARAAVMAAGEQLAGYEGSLAACGALAPTDGIVQAAQAAVSAAELFLPRVSAAAGQASQCAGLPGGASPGSTPDIEGATKEETGFGGGGPEKSPTSGTAGGGPPIKVVDHEKPPTAGTGEPAGPGSGPRITCYSEKTGQSYPMPYGSACPPPHLAPPAPHDPSTHWWEWVPKKGSEGGGHGGGSGGHP